MTIEVSFPDGNVRKYDAGTTALQIAQSISEGLARNVLAAKVNNEVIDANRPIIEDCTLSLLTWNDSEGKSTMWHSSAHLMAEALEVALVESADPPPWGCQALARLRPV